MDYEKKYKDALGWMKKVYPTMTGATREDAEHYFPELKESEDESIRKELLSWLKSKDGQTLPIDRYNAAIAWLEKQGEQKLIDKVEPKFKVGDFLVNDYCMGKVVELTNDAYLLDTGQGIPFSCEHNVHLWTTKDAKDGDVLIDVYGNIGIYKSHDDFDWTSYCDYNRVFRHFEVEHESEKTYPATKEQHDLLFQKMKEAGYKWDADKKELKKIKDKPLVIDEGKDEIDRNFTEMMLKDNTKQKPVPNWRPIDAEYMNKLCEIIDEYDAETTTKCCWKNWLKSLKKRIL